MITTTIFLTRDGEQISSDSFYIAQCLIADGWKFIGLRGRRLR